MRVLVTTSRSTAAVAAGTAGMIASYLGLLTAAARRRAASHGHHGPIGSGRRRFAIFVPAHDEHLVIAETIDSLLAQRYPSDLFEVHVVADNCTDDTADIARSHGAVVHERFDQAAPGKGHALNWLFDRVVASDPGTAPAPDAIVYVDADTTVDAGFLEAIDVALDGGARVVQGRYLVRNAAQSATAAIRYAALACRHDLRADGRRAIGGSCGLFGNGMAVDVEVMRTRRWSGHLVEDAEFQNELLLDGILVEYCSAARVDAEMPDDYAAATSQNARWERGRLEMARRYVPRLLSAAVRTGHGVPTRRAAVDAVADHLLPPTSLILAIDAFAVISSAAAVAVSRGRAGRVSFVVSVAASVLLAAHVVIGLRRVDAPASVYRSLLRAPAAAAWKLRLLAGIARADDVAWTRTARNTSSKDES
jgi:glycosyltransferase involved in cell wall biosynthesis